MFDFVLFNSNSLVKWLQAKEDGIEDSHVKVKDNITVSLSYKLEKKMCLVFDYYPKALKHYSIL